MNKKKQFAAAALSLCLSSGSLAAGFPVFAREGIAIYRLYNKNSGEHMYTTSDKEKTALINAGWTYEGIGWYGPEEGEGVYRVYNPNAKGGDHYYTRDKDEADSLVRLGWNWDNDANPVFYSGGVKPLYVAYNPNAESGAHNYTTTRDEQEHLLSIGWKYDEVAWNVISPGEPAQPASGLFSKMPTKFEFMNDIPTQFQLNKDGTFSGKSSSIEYVGPGPDHYTAVRNECSFSGKFATPVQVDQNKYLLKIEKFETERPTGEEWTKNGEKYRSTEPLGFEKGKAFYVYCPGTKTSSLPKEILGLPYNLGNSETLAQNTYLIQNGETDAFAIGFRK